MPNFTNNSNSTNLTNQLYDDLQYYTQEQVLKLIEEARITYEVDLVFILVCSIFIFLMQMGFAMLEAGTVRTKNSSNILLKNLLDTYVGAIVYYLVGYGLANDANGGIIGQYHFASTNFQEMDYLHWILQYSVCSNIPTIVAGSLAERTFVDTYMFFALLMTGLVYPIAAAWTWGGGWLRVLGFQDFGGAGVVHMLGGISGMVGTIILGPRLGIFGTTIPSGPSQSNKKGKANKHSQKPGFNIPIQNQRKSQKSDIQINHTSTDLEAGSQQRNNLDFTDEQNKLKEIYFELNHQQRRRSNSQRHELNHLASFYVAPKQIEEEIKTPKQFQPRFSRPQFQKNKFPSSDSLNVNPRSKQQSPKISGKQLSYYMSYLTTSSNNNGQQQQNEEQIVTKNRKVQEIQHLENVTNEQKSRIIQIRQEFPEFNLVDDRQLTQIIQLYDINIKSPIKPSSVSLIVQGTFFLWICWLFYNSGAAHGLNKHHCQPAQIIMNTIISSSASCVGILLFRPLISKQEATDKYSVQAACNSLLVGLVAITGCGNNVQPWASALIGLIGTLIYCLSCKLFKKLKIDDPLEASQIHAFCGLWGLMAVGFFDRDLGLLYTGNFNLLLKQLIGAFSIGLWAASTSFLYFYCLKKVNKFRVGYIYEITGMDVLMHGGTDLVSSEMLNKIEARQRSIANANRQSIVVLKHGSQ